MNSIFNQLLNVKGVVVETVRIVDSPCAPSPCSRFVCARAGACSDAHRCGRRRHGYDQGGGVRRWRHRDFGCWRVELVAMMPRVDCPGCGVVVASVPWAEPAAGSRATSSPSARADERPSQDGIEPLGVLGVPQPYPRDSRTREEDQETAPGHPQDHPTRYSNARLEASDNRIKVTIACLRLPPRHQPHSTRHAPLRRTRRPTPTTRNLTHENSRSLKSNE